MPVSKPTRYQAKRLGWVPTFLAALSCGKNISTACRMANISNQSAYHQRRVNPEFRAEWNMAVELGVELMERECERRAYHGVEEPVYYKGEVCGVNVRYSDTLLMFWLKAHKPEVYRDMQEQGKSGASVAIQVNIAAAALLREMITDVDGGLITDNSDSKSPELSEPAVRADAVPDAVPIVVAGPSGPTPC